MKNNLTATEKRKKFFGELKDLLAGATFPFMLMLILSATVIMFVMYMDETGLQILVLIVGEIMLIAATVIFGKQNGAVAYKKTVQNGNKREAGSIELDAKLYIGEYSPVKGVIIPLIACVPFIIVNIIYAAFPNDVCGFMLTYIFGWAYFPFKIGNLSPWLDLLCVIPYVGVHLSAYIWGGMTEKKKQDIIAADNERTAERKKK